MHTGLLKEKISIDPFSGSSLDTECGLWYHGDTKNNSLISEEVCAYGKG